MRVTAVIPVHNKAPWLRACLDSVLGQTWSDFELIAVDDCSTDDSLAVLRSFVDDRIRVIQLDRNLGPAGAAQRGHDAATGEYIIRVDADDVMSPDRFAAQVAFMDEHRGIGASGSWMELLNEPGALRTSELTDDLIRARSLFRIPIFQPTAIYRRSVLEQGGIRYEDGWPRYGEDWLFQLRLLRATSVANQALPLVHYRLGAQNASAVHDPIEGMRAVLGEVLAWHGLPNGAADMDAHLRLAGAFGAPMTAGDVTSTKRYLRRLHARARESGMASEEGLVIAFRKAWNDLGFQMPRFGPGAIVAYLLRDSDPSLAKWRYLFSSLIKGARYEPRTERIR